MIDCFSHGLIFLVKIQDFVIVFLERHVFPPKGPGAEFYLCPLLVPLLRDAQRCIIREISSQREVTNKQNKNTENLLTERHNRQTKKTKTEKVSWQRDITNKQEQARQSKKNFGSHMSLRVPLYSAILDSTDCWNSIPGALFLTLKQYKILGCTMYKSYFKYLNLVH